MDSWKIGGKTFNSRLLIGSALYPSPEIMSQAIKASNAGIVTVSLRRQGAGDQAGQSFWKLIEKTGATVLPNTAGCHSAKEAINTALMAREVFNTNWIKLEVIGDDYTLQPNPFELLKATETLVKEGFEVFPYMTDDLVLAQKLVDAGCTILMPWGAPIGSGKGLVNPYALTVLRDRFPQCQLIVDAGIGKPSDAVQAMELGYDGILLNSAIALAQNPVQMASAFKHSLSAGRLGYLAGKMQPKNIASPSTPTLGTPFWQQN